MEKWIWFDSNKWMPLHLNYDSQQLKPHIYVILLKT